MSLIPADFHARLARCLALGDAAEARELHAIATAAVVAGNARGFQGDISKLAATAGLAGLAKDDTPSSAERGTLSKAAPRFDLGSVERSHANLPTPLALENRMDDAMSAMDRATTPREEAEARKALADVRDELEALHKNATTNAAFRAALSPRAGMNANQFFGLGDNYSAGR